MKNNAEQFSGGEYLGEKYPDLKTSKLVELSNEFSESKECGIDNWLESIEKFHKRHRNNSEEMNYIRNAFRDEYVINPENIPESYFRNQQRLAREQGHGDIEITPEEKKRLAEVIINDQKSTLDNWVNYFTSSDADSYPMWAKYWAFRSMLKLSSFDKEKKSFGTRRKDTVAPFPDLNREALAYVIDIINKKANKENIPNQEGNTELEKLIQGENFGKLYAYAIEKVTPTETNELLTTEGEWIKYPQNSDHMPLVKSLQGHGTGWCTAGESTAEVQLKSGDFYVYYSKDKSGKPTIPRVAIRMEENQIGEVRGIAHEQNLDPYIGEVIDKKLSEFPDKEKYQKKTKDMKQLTEIEKKWKENKDLDKDDLEFLYEIDSKIEGFGFKKDPRIEEIKKERNIKKDYAKIYDLEENQVVDNLKDLNDKTRFYIGSEIYTPPIEKSSLDDIKQLGEVINLKTNLTNIDQNIADKLEKWEGDIIDNSWDVFYPNLQTIEGSIKADFARNINFNALRVVGGSISVSLAGNFEVDALQSVGGSIEANHATNFIANNLQIVGGNINSSRVFHFQAKKLQNADMIFLLRNFDKKEIDIPEEVKNKINFRFTGFY